VIAIRLTRVTDPDHTDDAAGDLLPAGGVSRPGGLVGLEETDAAALLDEVPLSEAEAGYVEAARAANTLRGYRSDWAEFTTWCAHHDRDPLPSAASTVENDNPIWPHCDDLIWLHFVSGRVGVWRVTLFG